MNFLVDTHCWLWWNLGSKNLSSRYYAIMDDPTNNILISAVVPWEVTIKYGLKKITLPEPPAEYFNKRMRFHSFLPLPISHAHALNIINLPNHHKDPFDRILISQSQIEDIPLLSQNEAISKYDVNIIAP